jgi:hypothetical protein
MVKIRDLTDQQIEEQITKYQKILDKLNKEKSLRGGEATTTATESNAAGDIAVDNDAQSSDSAEGEAFFLDFEQEEIQKFDQHNSEGPGADEEVDEEIRVTQLLQLSKKDLEELQSGKKKLKKKIIKKKVSK